MNTNARSLREKFPQQHEILFQCIHCGRHQTITLLTKGVCAVYMLKNKKICVQVLRTGASRNIDQCPCPQDLFTLLLIYQKYFQKNRFISNNLFRK
jgi:hypothetical protein